MPHGFDLTTDEVLTWEIEAVWQALDEGRVLLSAHAANEAALDALSYAEVMDTLAFYDDVSKDLPGNALGRAPGLNFDRIKDRGGVRVKVGWRGEYVVITVMRL